MNKFSFIEFLIGLGLCLAGFTIGVIGIITKNIYWYWIIFVPVGILVVYDALRRAKMKGVEFLLLIDLVMILVLLIFRTASLKPYP